MPSQRVAVVDLGTNSTRLLVADVGDGHVVELERRATVTRLGDGIDVSGTLADDAIARVFDALAEYRTVIDGVGDVEAVRAVATSAVRDAANGESFRAELSVRFDIDARIISGDEEARLTFLGATGTALSAPGGTPTATNAAGDATGEDNPGHAAANAPRGTSPRPPAAETLVIDIGGGSTEYVVGTPGTAPRFHVSTRMGSVRFTERHLGTDPPTPHELDDLAQAADATIAANVPDEIRIRPTRAIAVAGTPTSLAAIDQQLDPYDPAKVHGYVLTRDACERITAQLARVPTAERRTVVGLHPARAPTIVAGAQILVRSLYAFELDRIEVSETDILQGAALDLARP